MALTKVRGFGLGTLDDNITFSTAGKGVHLGVTSATSSNLLDDYEEGTFLPSAIGSTTAGTITNNSTPVGRYTKIGNQVNVFIQMNFSLSGEAGQLRITNLPFACSTGNESVGTFQCNDMGGSYASNVAQYTAVIQGDNDYLHFRGTKNNSGSHDTLSAQNMTFIRANIWYPTG